jgi:hypothetical protein
MTDNMSAFKEKLNSGGYANLGGARRAVSKFHEMAESDRDKARVLAEKYFGDPGHVVAAAPKRAAKAGAKRGPGRPPKAAAAFKPGQGGLPRPVKKATKRTAAVVPGNGSASVAASRRASTADSLSVTDVAISAVKATTTEAERIKNLDPDLDISGLLSDAIVGLRLAQQKALEVVGFAPRGKGHNARTVTPEQVQEEPDEEPDAAQGSAMGSVNLPGLRQQ